MTKLVSGWTEKNRTFLVQRVDGGVKIRSVPARYSFFMTGLDDGDRTDIARDNGVIGVQIVGRYTRVNCRNHWVRKDLVGILEDVIARNNSSAEIFEADVSPLRRLLTDISSLEVDPDPRIIFLDIESDSRSTFTEMTSGNVRMLTFAVCDCNGENAVSGCLKEDTDEGERELFGELFDALRGYDCVLAWYGDGFDFPMIQNRSNRLGVTCNGRSIPWHRWTWLDHLEVFKQHNSLGSGEEKSSFALNHVARYLLGEGKLDFDSSKTWEAWEAGGESRARLLRYNERDTALLPRIEEKTGYLALHMTVCHICRVFPDTISLNATVQGDGFLLRLGDEHGLRWPTKPSFSDDGSHEAFKGAFVMEPARYGSIENVHVADFAGLYPSIMRTFNMSPDTKVTRVGVYKGDCIKPSLDTNLCQLPERDTWFRTDKPGMFKIALDQLVAKRAEYAGLMKKETPGSKQHERFKRLSQAFKVVANSFYGIIGSPFSRFFDPEIAEGVTQTGKWLLQIVIKESSKVGLEALYADTDSIFVSGDVEEFKCIVKKLNDSWSSRLTIWGIDSHFIDLDFEKTFSRIIMIAAKRYVGKFSMYKGKPVPDDAPPEVKGVEFNRGDSIRLAREFQRQVIDRLLEKELPTAIDMKELVLDWKSRIYRGVLELDDIVMSQSLSKALKEYADPGPPHVRVARLMAARGEQIGEGLRVRYVVIPSGNKLLNPVPASEPGVIEKIDRVYYWSNKVYPPVQRVLEKVYPDVPWSETTKERRDRELEARGQKTLFDTIGSVTTMSPRVRRRRIKKAGLEITLIEGSPIKDGGAEKFKREKLLKAIKAAVDANPGDLPVTVVVMYKSYIEDVKVVKVCIDIHSTIEDTPKSRAFLMRIISKPDLFEFLP